MFLTAEPWQGTPFYEDGAGRARILELTGGLLPVLELFRKWLVSSRGYLPDQIQAADAEHYRDNLTQDPVAAGKAAEKLARGIPVELRSALHRLFSDNARDWRLDVVPRADLTTVCPHLGTLGEDGLTRLLDAAAWLHLVPPTGRTGEVRVGFDDIPGLIIRHPRFAAP
jgi:hypothetical protein